MSLYISELGREKNYLMDYYRFRSIEEEVHDLMVAFQKHGGEAFMSLPPDYIQKLMNNKKIKEIYKNSAHNDYIFIEYNNKRYEAHIDSLFGGHIYILSDAEFKQILIELSLLSLNIFDITNLEELIGYEGD